MRILVVVGVVALAACGSREESEAKQTAPAPAPAPAAQRPPAADVRTAVPIDVTAAKLWSDYADDETVADAKYRGKLLRVKGIVDKAARQKGDNAPVVILVLAAHEDGLWAHLTDAADVTKMKRGDVATLRCRGDKAVMYPELIDCVVEKVGR